MQRKFRIDSNRTARITDQLHDRCGCLSLLSLISAKTILSSGKQSVEEYTYDTKNPDQLISYKKDGVEKKIGKYKGLDPGQYDGRTLTWARGRELRSVTAGKNNSSSKQDKNKKKSEDGSSSVGTSDPDPDPASSDGADQFENISYEYDYNGVRIAKTVDNKRTEYIINGNRVLSQKTFVTGDKKKKDDKENTASGQYELINFYYSSSVKLLELGYSQNGEKETHYTVITNAVGDVVALYTSDGIRVGTYSYDPYGGITKISHNDNFKDTNGILEKNPFRYRSYYFDYETGWYYLNSRYYDPHVKRFINGDSTQLLTNTPENLMQYNLFMYCNGDPVNILDDSGENGVAIVAIGAIIAMTAIACWYIALQNYSMSYTVNANDSLSRAMDSVQEMIESGVEEFTLRNQNVYWLYDQNTNEIMYVGRTNDLKKREEAHKQNPVRKKYMMDKKNALKGLTKAEARAYEQALMLINHTYKSGKAGCNAINGIGIRNPKLFQYIVALQLRENASYIDNQLDNLLLNYAEGNL